MSTCYQYIIGCVCVFSDDLMLMNTPPSNRAPASHPAARALQQQVLQQTDGHGASPDRDVDHMLAYSPHCSNNEVSPHTTLTQRPIICACCCRFLLYSGGFCFFSAETTFICIALDRWVGFFVVFNVLACELSSTVVVLSSPLTK